MGGVDCAQALSNLGDYLKQELTPELAEEIRRTWIGAMIASSTPSSRRTFSACWRRGGRESCPASCGPGSSVCCGRGGATEPAVHACRPRGGGRRGARLGSPAPSPSGALAAWLVGAVILTGPVGPAPRYSPPSSFPADWSPDVEPADRRIDPKGDRRDAGQVLANGGAAALAALLGPARPELALWLVTGTLAAAAADTWASSLGRRSRDQPRAIWSRTRCRRARTAGSPCSDRARSGRRGAGRRDRGGCRRKAGALPASRRW